MENQTNTHPVATTATASDAGRVELAALPLHAILDELTRRGFGFLVHKDGSTLETGFPMFALACEVYRRQRAGECVALVITPDDVTEYWESDDSGATHPGSRVPDECEMHAMGKAFDRWQDTGGHGEIMEVLGDAWRAEQARKEGGRS